jgi:hypothetical protein
MRACVCATAVCVLTAGLQGQPRDVQLEAVTAWYERREASAGAVLCFGDSRSSWHNNRVPGQIIRGFDVQFARLFFIAAAGFAGGEDGLGQVMYGLPGVSAAMAVPGSTLPGTGLVNRYPVTIAEQWCGPTAGEGLTGSSYCVMHSTPGGAMRLSEAVPTGGTYYRGDPAQGRALVRTRVFGVEDSRQIWLRSWLRLGFNHGFSPVIQQTTLEPAAPAGGAHQIQAMTAAGPGLLGHGIAMRLGFDAANDTGPGSYQNKGVAWVGASVEFEGDVGIVLATVAAGGWNTRSHLPESVYAPGDNPYTPLASANGAKYSDEGFREWYSTCIGTPAALVRYEVGANVAAGGAFQEWGGTGAGAYKENTRRAVQRAVANLTACGVTDLVVELVGVYAPSNDLDGTRMRDVNQSLFELATEHGWSFYDQTGHLAAGGHAHPSAPWAIQYQYTSDTTHQNFAGMVLLGSLEWAAINNACVSACSADFDGDGDIGTDADIGAFFACLAGECDGCETADFDGDGDLGTDADIESFYRVLGGGPC